MAILVLLTVWDVRAGELLVESPATAAASPVKATASARFQDKLWAEDFVAFANRNAGGEWIVGRSDTACISEAEAARAALQAAAKDLMPLVETRLREVHQSWSGTDAKWLRDKIEAELQNGRLIADRFVQKFDRPYGTLWQEAVLVDTRRANMDRLVHDCMAGLNTRHRTFARSLFSGAGLVLAIYCLYLFLNGVTRGYFTGRLRLLAMVLVVVGIVIVMSLA
jgi:hypothetical protein